MMGRRAKKTRVAPQPMCEECDTYTQRRLLTKHKGKFKCPTCLQGPVEPISISVMTSNMGAWDEEPVYPVSDLTFDDVPAQKKVM